MTAKYSQLNSGKQISFRSALQILSNAILPLIKNTVHTDDRLILVYALTLNEIKVYKNAFYLSNIVV